MDRGPETLRYKEKLLLTGKGNARSVDWGNLTAKSLSFQVPFGHRRFRSESAYHTDENVSQLFTVLSIYSLKDMPRCTPPTSLSKGPCGCSIVHILPSIPNWMSCLAGNKSPLYIPPAPATSASSQSATSDLSTATTSSSAGPLPCLALPAHPSGPDDFTTAAPHNAEESPHMLEGLDKVTGPADPVPRHQERHVPGHSVCSALAAPARLVETTAGPSTAFAEQGCTAQCPEDSPAATSHVNEAKPIVPSALTAVSEPHQSGQRLIPRAPLFQALSKLCTAYSVKREDPAECSDGNQHVHRPTPASAAQRPIHSPDSNEAERRAVPASVHSRHSGEAEHRAAPAIAPSGCVQQLASQVNTARLSSPRRLTAPQGLNGPLLSRSRKRKATAPPVPPPEPQEAATIDLTMSDDDIPDTNSNEDRQLEAAPQGAHGLETHESLAVMVQVVNMDLKEKPILEEQLASLQDAVDSVSELKSLRRHELTDVLASVGKLKPIQMIRVRQYLNQTL